MLTRSCGFALLLLGLSVGLGCGGSAPGFHQSPTSPRCRRDAAADALVRDAAANALVRDAAADALVRDVADASADASWPLDTLIDSESPDGKPGLVSGDGESDALSSVDACEDDVSNLDGGRACGPSPWVLVGDVPNVRQLGGLPLRQGGAVACDLVYRGSSMSSMTQQGCERFAATGIKTVIDIRSESEQTSPPAACVTEQAKLVSAPLPTPYNVSPADYLADLYTAPSMQKVFAILANRAAYPVYYHCLYGKDRTGVVTAVILYALGASRQTIQDDYVMSKEAGFAIYPESLDAVLDELDRIGIDGYFRAVGVPAEHVQAMRAILLGSSPPPT
jgi:protein tyrosine phosphatase (PTP) superfamily phosphohydrolase (DUF442 family)